MEAIALKHWGLHADAAASRPITTAYGSIRDTGMAPTIITAGTVPGPLQQACSPPQDDAGVHRFVIKAHRQGKDLITSRQTMQYRIQLQRILGAGGIPVPNLMPILTADRDAAPSYFAEEDGCFFTVAEFHVGGAPVLRERATEPQQRALGRMAARMQNAIKRAVEEQQLVGSEAFPYVHRWMSRDEVLANHVAQWTAQRDTLPTDGAMSFDEVLQSANQCRHALQSLAPHMPTTVATHNDFGFPNCHFESDTSDEIVFVYDFDTAQAGQRAGEFNNLLWARPGHLPFVYSKQAVMNAVDGYASEIDGGLSAEERAGIVEIGRSRLIEAVIRHELRLYMPFILKDPTFDSMRSNRYETLMQFNIDFPQ